MDAIRALIGHNIRFMVAIGNVIGCHNKEQPRPSDARRSLRDSTKHAIIKGIVRPKIVFLSLYLLTCCPKPVLINFFLSFFLSFFIQN